MPIKGMAGADDMYQDNRGIKVKIMPTSDMKFYLGVY